MQFTGPQIFLYFILFYFILFYWKKMPNELSLKYFEKSIFELMKKTGLINLIMLVYARFIIHSQNYEK
jgi:hypothetical protein